jgi:hypothetical protein
MVILITAMQHGATPRRVRELSELTGADRRTIDRWRVFWQDVFPQTRFWRTARGRLVPRMEVRTFPRSLMDAFFHAGATESAWGNLLKFLSPITISRGLLIAGSE